jgi:iron complex transport system substrate-binding protein
VRIVSMLPSATEIVYALGLDDDLVGVTFECNEPARARLEKRIVVGGRDTSGMTPGDIDRYVRDQLAAGDDLYTLDAGALAEIAPDVILTQDLCRVCALPTTHVEDALDYLGCRADVISLDPHTLEAVLDSITSVGKRLGVEQRADQLVAGLRARLDAVASRVAALPRPRVAVLEWIDPPFTGGHWVPDLICAAGGQPVASDAGEDSRERRWDEIDDARPDLVLVSPCGFDLDGAAAQALVVAEQLPGVPVWAIDADGLVVRPGPRLVEGVEAIAAALHPDPSGRMHPGIRRIA